MRLLAQGAASFLIILLSRLSSGCVRHTSPHITEQHKAKIKRTCSLLTVVLKDKDAYRAIWISNVHIFRRLRYSVCVCIGASTNSLINSSELFRHVLMSSVSMESTKSGSKFFQKKNYICNELAQIFSQFLFPKLCTSISLVTDGLKYTGGYG